MAQQQQICWLAGCKSSLPGSLLLFENVDARNVIGFIKEIHFYMRP